jgi:hypothetical protein
MIFSLLLCTTAAASAERIEPVVISNVVPRTEASSGKIIDAHDGSIQLFDGPRGKEFFGHLMGYGYNLATGDPEDCPENGHWCVNCGRHLNNTVGVWTSTTLAPGSWVHRAQAMVPGQGGWPLGEYYRSHLLYNPETKRYVLWVQSSTVLEHGESFGVGSSTSPDGPFQYEGVPGVSGGDFGLFRDDTDGAGYMICTNCHVHGAAAPKPNTKGGRTMIIFRLNDNFTGFASPVSSSGVLPGPALVEAPDLFERKGVYYAMLGGCTCFGKYGSGAAYATAKHPLGPYSYDHARGQIDPGCNISAMPSCYDAGPKGPSQVSHGTWPDPSGQQASGNCQPVTQAQQNYMVQYPTSKNETGYIWTGDKWQSAPDKPTALFAHDFQTWLPLEFDSSGAILPLRYVDNFTIHLADLAV